MLSAEQTKKKVENEHVHLDGLKAPSTKYTILMQTATILLRPRSYLLLTLLYAETHLISN